MINPESTTTTLAIIGILESLQIPYVIGGSFASTAYGHVRTTMDVDLVADLQVEKVPAFIQALGDIFYHDEDMIRNAIHRRSSFNLIHLATMFKVDIFIPKERPFDNQQLARRIPRVLDPDTGQTAYFASPEDTILAKLEWYRLGGEVSERQWRDVEGILHVQKMALDLDYLRKTADTLHIRDLLEKVLQN